MESVHGTKYIIDGEIENPAGKVARARTIWIIDVGTDFPRLSLASKVSVGYGQYRNAVASVRRGASILMPTAHPTLPRYGTDCGQGSAPDF
jgi:hypothetical protein